MKLQWTDRYGNEQSVLVDWIKTWEVREGQGTREHPEGTVIEGYRGGMGGIQLHANERIGGIYITEVE